ncbi:MAG: Mesorhizobium phage vB MloP Lo5R7ANS [Pseudomonadota bacterium]|jgi:hypothetical protein
MQTLPTYYRPASLFSVDTNPKTLKGQKYGFKTAVLYMAPADLSGVNLCPMAFVAKCDVACLNTAGNPAYAETKRRGRLNKAHYFLSDRVGFMRQVAREIARTARKVSAEGFKLLVRLNGTTDIRWELIPVDVDAKTAKAIGVPSGVYPSIFAVFPDVQFYDYTKIPNRHSLPTNYDLTFSYSGVAAFAKHVDRARSAGMRIAVVFRSKKDIPESFIGMECVDGDDSDIRHLDPRGVVVALYAKGKAKNDASGFVVDSPKRTGRIIPILAA